MTDQHYDAIIVGSGAGGAATAFNLVRAGKRALVLERGDRLPRDGSTLDVKQVFKVGRFKNHDPWVDNYNRVFIPDEHYNVGGKTKWYGAALLRFSPDEFEADPAHQCLAWPFGYDELKPYYEQAEELLRINRFDNEPELQALIDKIAGGDSSWRAEPLPLGLKKEVLEDENEAKHFDGFASACAYKSDAEWNLLTHIEDKPNFTLMPNKQVVGFLHAQGAPQEITGVACTDGSTYRGSIVILAAGAMTSPRLLQDHLERTGLERTLPSAAMVGANFKFHINSALLALSPFERHDVLRKTAIFFNDAYPHSNVQCLGWMDGDILATQLPAAVPKFVTNAAGARAVGFFVTTEGRLEPREPDRLLRRPWWPTPDGLRFQPDPAVDRGASRRDPSVRASRLACRAGRRVQIRGPRRDRPCSGQHGDRRRPGDLCGRYQGRSFLDIAVRNLGGNVCVPKIGFG